MEREPSWFDDEGWFWGLTLHSGSVVLGGAPNEETFVSLKNGVDGARVLTILRETSNNDIQQAEWVNLGPGKTVYDYNPNLMRRVIRVKRLKARR